MFTPQFRSQGEPPGFFLYQGKRKKQLFSIGLNDSALFFTMQSLSAVIAANRSTLSFSYIICMEGGGFIYEKVNFDFFHHGCFINHRQ